MPCRSEGCKLSHILYVYLRQQPIPYLFPMSPQIATKGQSHAQPAGGRVTVCTPLIAVNILTSPVVLWFIGADEEGVPRRSAQVAKGSDSIT